jgi:Cu/Zn superoxide dismutase
MTHLRRLAGSLAAAGFLAALTAAAPAADAPAHHVYALAAQNGSGELGTVTLTALGDKTRVELALANAPAGPQPVHFHAGSCAKLDPKPKYPLTSAVDGLSVTMLDVPMAQLVGGGLAVNVHESTTNIPKYVACGDVGPAK